MKVKKIIFSLALGIISFLGFSQEEPNILYIMADDHAVNAISCYGSRLAEVAPTPNIDRLAREGIRMDNMMVTNSICTPSRAAIISGQYSQKNEVYTLADSYNPNADNLPKEMQKAGYETAIIGKWHLKKEPKGFDYYNVLPGQGLYIDPKLKEISDTWQDSNKGGKVYKGYVTDIITNLAIKWLDQRDKNKPFFLMVHHKAPHGLWEPPKRNMGMFKNVFIPEPESLYHNGNHGPLHHKKYGTSISLRNKRRNMVYQVTNKYWPNKHWLETPIDTTGLTYDEKTSAAYQEYLKEYLRTVAAVDEDVGKLLDYLDANGLTKNTVVIYTSDQGMFLGEHDYIDKRWMYEESSHMPFLVRYPKEIKKGSVNNNICLNIDIAPTFLDYAGMKAPDFMQGRSFRGILKGNRSDDWRKAMYYRYWMHMAHHDNPAHYGIRTKKYKLIFFYGLPLDAKGAVQKPTPPYWEMYDLSKDPKEMNNVYEQPGYRYMRDSLKVELLRLKKYYGDTDKKYPALMKIREKAWNK